jgi:hypothetical protein
MGHQIIYDMKIVSFPHYTCGGLLCDILNDTFSPVAENGGIDSIHHNIGKIGDHAIYSDFDFDLFLQKVKNSNHADSWIGTHCWLGNVDTAELQQIINVTTVTYHSRLYRWIRAYHHHYLHSADWQNLSGFEQIDKQRETAKEYTTAFLPIDRAGVVNIEFADIVNVSAAFTRLVKKDVANHINRWRDLNSFLYSDLLWSSTPAQRFYEAEYEILSNQRYVYE